MRCNRIAILLILLTIKGFAEVRDGVYAGLGVGACFTHTSNTVQNVKTKFKVNSKGNSTDAIGSAFIGYGYTFNCKLYLAGELGTYFPKRSIEITRPGAAFTNLKFTDRVSVQDWLTGDILLGFRPYCPLLVYLRGGISYSNIKFHIDANPLAPTPDFNSSKQRAGGRVGLGVNYPIWKGLGIGVDYIYTKYAKFTTSWSRFDVKYKSVLHSNYVGVSLFYGF